MPRVGVVIPTKNEAETLPLLLRDLRHQSLPPSQIFVADAHSSDGTLEICKAHGVEVVAGGRPAEGRNAGARVVEAELILFLDADVRIDRGFIEEAVGRLVWSGCGGASFGFSVEGGRALRLIHRIAEFYFVLMSGLGWPRGMGGAILARREVHEAIGGFDTTVTVGEDHEYLGRLNRVMGYKFFRAPKVLISTRRFERQGILFLSLKWIRIETYRVLRGEVRDERFGYFDED